jgi:hypothetical protein
MSSTYCRGHRACLRATFAANDCPVDASQIHRGNWSEERFLDQFALEVGASGVHAKILHETQAIIGGYDCSHSFRAGNQQDRHMPAVTLDYRDQVGVLRGGHADAVDDHVGHLVALVGRVQLPIDLIGEAPSIWIRLLTITVFLSGSGWLPSTSKLSPPRARRASGSRI